MERISLFHRARIIRVQEGDAPAADALRFVSPSAYSAVLRKFRAAFDGPGAKEGFESIRVLPGIAPSTRSAAQWEEENDAFDGSVRASQNFVFATGSLEEKVRRAAFQRRIVARSLQRRCVSLGLKMRRALAPILKEFGMSVGDCLLWPPTSPWPFGLSCIGSVVCAKTDCRTCPRREDVRPLPGCSPWERRTLMIALGVTQLVRRLGVWGDPECMWLLRATHNSDEVRHPESIRKSFRAPACSVVRGFPLVPGSTDYWPGVKSESRPDVPPPAGEPCGEPGDSPRIVATLQSDLPAHGRKKMRSKRAYPPPASVPARLNGADGPVPPLPVCTLGLPEGTAGELLGAADAA